jgi:hypothetical protein
VGADGRLEISYADLIQDEWPERLESHLQEHSSGPTSKVNIHRPNDASRFHASSMQRSDIKIQLGSELIDNLPNELHEVC